MPELRRVPPHQALQCLSATTKGSGSPAAEAFLDYGMVLVGQAGTSKQNETNKKAQNDRTKENLKEMCECLCACMRPCMPHVHRQTCGCMFQPVSPHVLRQVLTQLKLLGVDACAPGLPCSEVTDREQGL